MKIDQPRISETVYELVKVVELDVEIGEDHFALRIELFHNNSSAHSFRAHLWRSEMYRIQSTFPQDESTNEPAHLPSDELILIDHSHYLARSYSNFQAESQAAALQMIIDDFQGFLTRVAKHD